jgi:hypothetical protein
MKRLQAALLVCVLSSGPAAFAQPPASEVQVALEPTGRLFEVDASLAQRTGLFVNEYPGFRGARLFQTGDSTFVLEITTVREGVTSRQRVPMTPAEVDVLRRDIAQRIASASPERMLDQEGRARLVGGYTALGFGFYGWAAPVAFDLEDDAAVGLYLLVGGASFFVPYAATNRAVVTQTDTDFSLYGATRGIVHGLMLRDAFDGDHTAVSDQVAVGIAALASAVEGTTFYAWSRGAVLDDGAVSSMGMLSDFGMLSAYGLAAVIDQEEDRSARAIAGLTGAGAGLFTGKALADPEVTRGDGGIQRTAMWVGAYIGGSLGNLAVGEGGGANPTILGAIAGGAGGILAGPALVRGRDFSIFQTRLVALGTIAGGLMGFGTALFGDTYDDGTAFVTSAFGAAIGFAATYGSQRGRAIEVSGLERRERTADRLTFEVSPLAIAESAMHHENGSRAHQPWVVARWAFDPAR